MNDLIEKMQHQIIDAVNLGEDLNEASWGNQKGVLITANEAAKIVAFYKYYKLKSNIQWNSTY